MWPKSSSELFEVTRGAHITLIAQQHSKWLSHYNFFHCCILPAPVLKLLDHVDPNSGETISTCHSIIKPSEWLVPHPGHPACHVPNAVPTSCKTPAYTILWIDTKTTVGQRLRKKGKALLGEKTGTRFTVHTVPLALADGPHWHTAKSTTKQTQRQHAPAELRVRGGGWSGMTEMVNHSTCCMANIPLHFCRVYEAKSTNRGG